MLIERFHIELEQAVDKRDNSAVPELGPEVKDYFLNEAQDRFIKLRYGKNNLYKAGFEEIQKRTDDLKALVRTEIVPTAAVTYEDGVFKVDLDALPSTDLYMFYLRCRAEISKESCPSKYVDVKLVTHDKLHRAMSDPFNKPEYGYPLAYFEDSDVLVMTDGTYTVPNVKLTYLKRPNQMNLGSYGGAKTECELSEYTHKEIIQLAVDIIIENIESPRIQTTQQRMMTTE